MRAFLAASLAAALGLVACGGCTSTKMPSLPTFGFKGKNSKTSPSQMTNAPPAPQLNSMAAGTGPAVSMPQSASWSNLPVYPGTTYQQTPYPEQALASTATAPSYSSYPPVAQGVPTVPNDPASGGYPPSYGAMPPSVANNSTPAAGPYSQYPATAGAAPSNAGQQQAVPNWPQPAPPYAQQQITPYAQQPAPYTQQPAPYGQQPDPYNAANPYENYTR